MKFYISIGILKGTLRIHGKWICKVRLFWCRKTFQNPCLWGNTKKFMKKNVYFESTEQMKTFSVPCLFSSISMKFSSHHPADPSDSLAQSPNSPFNLQPCWPTAGTAGSLAVLPSWLPAILECAPLFKVCLRFRLSWGSHTPHKIPQHTGPHYTLNTHHTVDGWHWATSDLQRLQSHLGQFNTNNLLPKQNPPTFPYPLSLLILVFIRKTLTILKLA